MMSLLLCAFSTLAACLMAWLLTPWMARLAMRMGAVDRPDGHRKSHAQPIPRAGGVVVALVSFIAVTVTLAMASYNPGSSSAWLLRGLLPAVAMLVLVGVLDDVLTLTGIYKLIGQVFAVSVLVAGGTQFDQVSMFGHLIPLGDLRIPFTMFFCLGAINAFNLIDGADGLASIVGAIVCVTLGIITSTRSDIAASILCFTMAGALIGFLRYNLPPAKVYLGDTGSMLIGLMVAALAIHCSIKQEAAFVLSVPVAICAIPILDAAAALVRRITTGQSVFTPDRGHLHHALLLRGWSIGKTVAIIGSLTAVTCSGALLSYFTNSDLFALLISAGVVAWLAAARIFGHVETALIASRSRSVVRAMISRSIKLPRREIESSVQLQGTRHWQGVWMALREAAPMFNICGLTLQIAIPHLHESFYANWKSKDVNSLDRMWHFTLPLTLEDRPIGKLTLAGADSGRKALVAMQQLLEHLDLLHGEVAQLALGNLGEPTSDETWPAAPTHAVSAGAGAASQPAEQEVLVGI